MDIVLKGVGKRFRQEWIFRNLSIRLPSGSKTAITGHNGSGKSTLLQIIGAVSAPSAGTVEYLSEGGAVISPENAALHHLSFCAPYQELPEELTGEELYHFHFTFRKARKSILCQSLFESMGMKGQEYKSIKFYSSGMKQRLKLSLCLQTEAEVYLLDEPTSNLDEKGCEWFQEILAELPVNKTFIISSNIRSEYLTCDTILSVLDYK